MAKYRGTVKHTDLEGGLWELHAESGEVYELDGGGADLRRDGVRVEIEGTLARGMVSIGMRGGVLRVKKYTLV
jgi:hypothetical protein